VKRFFKIFLMIIGAGTLGIFISGIVLAVFFRTYREDVPDKTVLELDFDKGFEEYVPDDPAARMMSGKTPTVLDVIESLQQASEDKRVIGLIGHIGNAEMGLARIQELRNAISAFRAKGKTAVAYSDTFGEFGPGNGAYYLATAFKKIYLQPSGDIGLTGLMFETRFLKGTLDKVGIKPRMDHRREYKNAMNVLTETGYTEPHKEALCKIMSSQFEQIIRDIGKARDISESDMISLTDHGFFLGQEACNAKLADELAYRDKVYEDMKKIAGENAEFLPLMTYRERAGLPSAKGETLALIYGVGAISRGENEYNALSGNAVMGSETVAKAFRAAIEDKEVKAILFRVSSPGGSYIGSDTIWRETVRAKQAGKPVIVSMGDVAGSGGYFVAMAADKIVAQPGTITGSVGVLAGKLLTSDLWDKLGISHDEIHTGSSSTMWSGTNDYSPEQWDRLQDALDRIYADFTGKVAEGRKLDPEDVSEVAKGRIWTGEDAEIRGLVDELGGFPEAIQLAKKAAGIPENAEICLKLFPKKKAFLDLLEEKASDVTTARILSEIQPIVQAVGQIGILGEQGVLSMQGFEFSVY